MNKLWPMDFDSNEWFVTICMISAAIMIYYMPRRFPTIVTLTFFALGMGIALYIDYHLGTLPADLYRINDGEHYELYDAFVFLLYCSFSYFFMYYLDKWRLTGIKISIYVLAWAVGSTAFEALAVFFRLYSYHGWMIKFSFLFYLTAQAVLVAFYYLIKGTYGRTKREGGTDWA